MAKIASAIGDRETMVELRGYGFAPVAAVLSFVADNCDGQNKSGGNKLPLLVTPNFRKPLRRKPCDDVHQSERRRN
jgi:hypothetical protein